MLLLASLVVAETKFHSLSTSYSTNAWLEVKTNPVNGSGYAISSQTVGWPAGVPVPLSMYSMKLRSRQWTNDLLNPSPPRYYCGVQVKDSCAASTSNCYTLTKSLGTTGVSLPPNTSFAYVTSRHKWQELSFLAMKEDYTSHNGTRSTLNGWKGIHPTSGLNGTRGPAC